MLYIVFQVMKASSPVLLRLIVIGAFFLYGPVSYFTLLTFSNFLAIIIDIDACSIVHTNNLSSVFHISVFKTRIYLYIIKSWIFITSDNCDWMLYLFIQSKYLIFELYTAHWCIMGIPTWLCKSPEKNSSCL